MELAQISQQLLYFNPTYVNKILAETKLFFIISLGRSGTMFLSSLLDETLERKIRVFHELSYDRTALVRAYADSKNARDYLSGYRGRVIAARIFISKCRVYGEVNSYLRYHVEPIQELWNPTILHLVRDGRSVVRSIMNRKAFLPSDRDHSGKLGPLPNDPWAAKWQTMDRFERVCWYWAHSNRHLLKYELPLVRFEEITSSYDMFLEQVSNPLKIKVSFQKWNTQANIPKNENANEWFPHWEKWSLSQKKQFEKICAEVMDTLGYAF